MESSEVNWKAASSTNPGPVAVEPDEGRTPQHIGTAGDTAIVQRERELCARLGNCNGSTVHYPGDLGEVESLNLQKNWGAAATMNTAVRRSLATVGNGPRGEVHRGARRAN